MKTLYFCSLNISTTNKSFLITFVPIITFIYVSLTPEPLPYCLICWLLDSGGLVGCQLTMIPSQYMLSLDDAFPCQAQSQLRAPLSNCWPQSCCILPSASSSGCSGWGTGWGGGQQFPMQWANLQKSDLLKIIELSFL